MNDDEFKRAIEAAVDVSPSLVFQAKAHLVAHASGYGDQMVAAFVDHMGSTLIQPVVIHQSADPRAVVAAVARWLSCQRAAREAIWALIGSGAVVPLTAQMDDPSLHVGWTTVVPGSGGSSSGWDFGRAIPVPSRLSLGSAGPTHLTDGDLFLATLDLPGLDERVAGSLHAAVACFRHDLYLPAQVMLGRAAEGCWIVLAHALIEAVPATTEASKMRALLDERAGFARLLSAAVDLYAHAAVKPIRKAADVSLDRLQETRVWTDAVREARNAVHPATDAPLPATWETTAALLMGAVPNVRRLWVVAEAARAAASP
jgi:hypothetical protein